MATIYVAILGKGGLRRVGELATAKAHYAAERLTSVPGVRLRFGAPFFKEFALELPKSPDRVVKRLLKSRILAGVPLKPFDRPLRNTLLVAVTERRTREEIDAYATALAAACA
jgi:glycine dehydrogenase subunit 1